MRKSIFSKMVVVFCGFFFVMCGGCKSAQNSASIAPTVQNQKVSLSEVREAAKNEKRRIPNDQECRDLSILSAKLAAEGKIECAYREHIEVLDISKPERGNIFSGVDAGSHREEVYLPVTFTAKIKVGYERIPNFNIATINVKANFYENANGVFTYNIESANVSYMSELQQ